MSNTTLSINVQSEFRSPAPVLVKGASLAEQAYDFVKGNIISLQFAPGSPILENQLAKQLGISRSPMREALARLEREGFIEIVPWKGAKVQEITRKYIFDLFQCRICLEGMAARLAVPRISRQELEASLAAIDQLAPRLEAGDGPAFYDHEVIFHDLFTVNCDNELLRSSIVGIRDHVSRIRNYISSSSKGRVEPQSLNEHRAIAHAFLTGSGDAAEAAVRRHLENVLDRVLSTAF